MARKANSSKTRYDSPKRPRHYHRTHRRQFQEDQTTGRRQDGPYVTQQQANDLWKIGYEPTDRRGGLTKDQINKVVKACGFDHISMIPQSDYERVLNAIKVGLVPQG